MATTYQFLSHLCIPSLVLVHVDRDIAVCLEKSRGSSDLSAVVFGLIVLFQSRKERLDRIKA
jgi:hypothetical protein